MDIESGVRSALEQPESTSFVLVEMMLDGGPVRLAGWHSDVVWQGETYLAFAGIGQVDAIKETTASQNGLSFSMPLVNDAAVVNVLTTEFQNRPVIIRLAVLVNGLINASTVIWRGTLDAARLQYGSDSDSVQVTAEHDLTRWNKPSGTRMNNDSQQAKHPGDRFFEYCPQYEDARISWPGKEFYRQ